MRSYTAYTRPLSEPVLVVEGWSWGAALFGPFWLLAQRAWVPGLLFLAASVLAGMLAPAPLDAVIALGFAVLSGLLGRDALRWSLEQRGYALSEVVMARDHDSALARLLHARPDLHAAAMEQLA